METQYWVRHAQLTGFVGPLAEAQILAAMAAGSLPGNCAVRVAAGGGKPEVLDGTGWEPAWRRFGLPEPPSPPPPPPKVDLPPVGVPGLSPQDVLLDVRERSSYGGARSLAALLAVVAFLAIALGVVVGVLSAVKMQSWPMAMVTLGGGALEVAGAMVLYQAFLMLADIADCHLRRDTESSVRRVRPGA
ncbi:MAG: hypothetical protein JNK15_01080 [Planctomycetes bacterium]|nr:hypothetical protein [Planctomycetota bacterium]